jgi:hypothetical protein
LGPENALGQNNNQRKFQSIDKGLDEEEKLKKEDTQ